MAIGRFRAANRDYWDGEVAFNLESWDIDAFFGDPARLSRIVAAEREALGDVRGRSLIHLQCHFGLDTLAWSRRGADVTGVDFSPRAIATAIELAKRDGVRARFIEADLYETPQAVRELFDFVYTSGGVLCWLPDIRRWADVVSRLLRPGGVFYIREAHPMLWSLEDERDDEQLVIGLPYFEISEPKGWDAAPARNKERTVPATHYVWQQRLGEIVSALIEAGLTIQFLKEHRTCLWQALPFMVQDGDGWWRLPDRRERLPLMYSIRALKAWSATGLTTDCARGRPPGSRRPHIQGPHKPIRIAPLRLSLHDEGFAGDGQMIAGARLATSLARTSNIAVSAWMRLSPKPTMVSGRRAMTRTGSGSPPAGV